MKQASATMALSPRVDAVDLGRLERDQLPARLALLLGTEGAGLSPELLAAADKLVRIPIRADFDSLNGATTSGIALHTYRSAYPLGPRPEARVERPAK